MYLGIIIHIIFGGVLKKKFKVQTSGFMGTYSITPGRLRVSYNICVIRLAMVSECLISGE